MLSHSQVQDQRGQWRGGIGFSRLPIGYFTLTLAGEITGVDWTLDLYDAELRGTVTTTRGSLSFSALVQNDTSALLISTRPTPGEESAAWSFQWLRAATTRNSGKPEEYTPNPGPRVGDGFVEQPLLAGGGWTTAWRERREGTGRLLAAHLVYRFPGQVSQATADTLRAVDRTLTADRRSAGPGPLGPGPGRGEGRARPPAALAGDRTGPDHGRPAARIHGRDHPAGQPPRRDGSARRAVERGVDEVGPAGLSRRPDSP